MQTQPPTLHDDVGFIVARDVYQSDLFSLRIPQGWRVVTGERAAPPSVLLVAPDDCALIQVSSTPLDDAPISPNCNSDDLHSELRTITTANTTLYLAGSAPSDEWTVFVVMLEGVAASLEG